MAELADALVLGASAQKACRFKSCSRHQSLKHLDRPTVCCSLLDDLLTSMLLTFIEQHSHHTGISLTICRRDTATVAVHGHGDCRVAHQLALHQDGGTRFTRFIQPRAIAVTKRMPSDGAVETAAVQDRLFS